MVMMCRLRVSLMRSMIAASVVDLPEPVGPVTSTRPLSQLRYAPHLHRQAELVDGEDLRRDDAKHRARAALLAEDIHAIARHSGNLVREISVAAGDEAFPRTLRGDRLQ